MDENIGKKYDRLKIIAFHSKEGYSKKYTCLCDCGNVKNIYLGNLRSGKSTSCGCFQKQQAIKANIKHGERNKRLYSIWTNMKTRCYNSNVKGFKNYGDRGISICKEWREDFGSFLSWAKENGYEENLTIERVNFDGNYEPSNCTWIEVKNQSKNRRSNLYVTIDEKTTTLKEWCRFYDLNYKLVHQRMKRRNESPLKSIEFYLSKLIETEELK